MLLFTTHRPIPALIAGLLCLFISCLIWFFIGLKTPLFLSKIDNEVNDLFFQIRGPIDTSGSVIIVDIDERSLRQVGQWPWSRDTVAKLVDAILETKADVLGFTVVFAEHDRSSPDVFLEKYHDQLSRLGLNRKIDHSREVLFPDHDKLLGKAIARGTTVQGFNFIFREDFLRNIEPVIPRKNILVQTHFSNPNKSHEFNAMIPTAAPSRQLPIFFHAYRAVTNIDEIGTGTTEGFLNTIPSNDGIIRRAPAFILLDGESYPSFALEMFRLIGRTSTVFIETDAKLTKSEDYPITALLINDQIFTTDRWGRLGINFYGPYNTFLYISAVDLLNGDITLPKGSHVLLGSSVSGIGNVVSTPLTSQLPEVELHATILDNLIQGNTLKINNEITFNFTFVLLIFFGSLITLTVVYLQPLFAFSLCGLSLVATFAASYYLFIKENVPFSLSFVLCALTILFFVVILVRYSLEGKRRRFIRQAFSQYVAPSVVQELLKHPENLNLHVDNREVTILFCDIRDFSSIAESVAPEELSRMLNSYFSLLTEIILKHKGTVDKYIGDAIMAVWGSPLHDKQHATHAVRAALAMIETLKEASPRLFDREISIGIGINSGMVSAGNFGSEKRFDYTVFGDNVNLAARVEQETKRYREDLLITEHTKVLLAEDLPCVYVDTVMVRGRMQEVQLYTPLAHRNSLAGR